MAKRVAKDNSKIPSDFSRIFDDSIKNLSHLQSFSEILKIVVDEAYEGIIILDERGYIQYTNRKHAEYFNTPQENVVHKHISEMAGADVAKGFMEVIRTGKPELLRIYEDGGKDFIANRFPIKKEGKVIGAAGAVLFDIKEVDAINKKISLLEHQLNSYKRQLRTIRTSRYSLEDIVGESDAIRRVKSEAQKAAQKNAHILLVGESGTGKELFAHAIHNQSRRKFGPFIRVNCSAIPRELLESELFGYEPGSFTGAKRSGKKGKFELADKGSIFLDEIADMPLQMQSELLRVLQEKEVDRIGGTTPVKVDFRLIAATNKNLEEMVQKGTFREDLFYRLNVIKIELPPLRKRIEDIPILTEYFLEQKSRELGLEGLSIAPQALTALQGYKYPGNIRELMNILEKAINRIDIDVFSKGAVTITKEDVGSVLRSESASKESAPKWDQLREAKNEQEVKVLRGAIQASEGNITKCAEMIGIHRTGLHRKIRQYNLHEAVVSARKKTW